MKDVHTCPGSLSDADKKLAEASPQATTNLSNDTAPQLLGNISNVKAGELLGNISNDISQATDIVAHDRTPCMSNVITLETETQSDLRQTKTSPALISNTQTVEATSIQVTSHRDESPETSDSSQVTYDPMVAPSGGVSQPLHVESSLLEAMNQTEEIRRINQNRLVAIPTTLEHVELPNPGVSCPDLPIITQTVLPQYITGATSPSPDTTDSTTSDTLFDQISVEDSKPTPDEMKSVTFDPVLHVSDPPSNIEINLEGVLLDVDNKDDNLVRCR